MRLFTLLIVLVISFSVYAEVEPPAPVVIDSRIEWMAVDAVAISVWHNELGKW